MIELRKHAVITIILLIILLSTTLTIKTRSENPVTTTYPEATYTVSETSTYTRLNTPTITVLLYSDGSIKVSIHNNWSDPLPQGFLSYKEIEFYDDHVTYNYEFKSPSWDVGNNNKFSYTASGKTMNGVFRGHMVITYINETSNLHVNVDYIIRDLNDSAMALEANLTMNGTKNMINQTLNTIQDIGSGLSGIKVENIKINKQENNVQVIIESIIHAGNGITFYTSSSFILPAILGEAIPISPNLIDKVTNMHTEAIITNSTITMKQSGEYKVGYKEFLSSIVDTLNKSHNENDSGSEDMAKLLNSLINNFETFNGEKFIYIMNSTGQEIILPKMRKMDTRDPLETLTALRDVVLQIVPKDVEQEFLNTTIKLEPGDSNIKSITPNVVKLSDLGKVEVDIASSNKYLGVASAIAIIAIIATAIIILEKNA